MKKNIFFTLCLLSLSFITHSQVYPKYVGKSKIAKVSLHKPSKKATVINLRKVAVLRKNHAQFLANNPFKAIVSMSNTERKLVGLTPNKYYEDEWILTMNPETGRPTPENLQIVRRDLELARLQGAMSRNPGDALDNSWVERGPNNVGGRSRAVMFDPSDATNETVFAGGVSGGLWKNTNISNAGSVWTRVDMPENLAVSAIAADPNNNSVFYVGTGESYVNGDVNGDGVWKSSNAGLTWTRIFGGISGVTAYQSNNQNTVTSPPSLAGNYTSTYATGFGAQITSSISGNAVLVNDGTATPTRGCAALINASAVNGNIALIRRGDCPFVDKALYAQNAGAIGVIIMNNIDGNPVAMGGSVTNINIPVIMVSQAVGDAYEAALLLGPVTSVINPVNNSALAGNIVPGVQHINDLKVRNNNGVSEIFVSAGDSSYGSANSTTFLGSGEYGLYKSLDGGVSWSVVSLPLTAGGKRHCPNDVEFGANNVVWLSTTKSTAFDDGGGTIFSSVDGTNFVKKYEVSSGDRTQIAVSKTTPNLVYVLAQLPVAEVLLKTTDGFTSTPATLSSPVDADTGMSSFTNGQAFYNLPLFIDPMNDQIIYTGGIDLFKSTNGGSAWNQLSHWYGGFGFQEVHSDQHAFAIANNNSSKVLFGNDGGIYFSANGGLTTTARTNGLNVTQFYSVAVAPIGTASGLTGDYFVAGAQDNGSQYFSNPAQAIAGSIEVQGGDGATCLFDQGTDKYYITNYVYNGNINSRTAPNGAVKSINNEALSSPSGAFIAVMALDSKVDMLFSDYTSAVSGSTVFQVRRYSNIKPGSTGVVVKSVITNALLTSQPSALTVSRFGTATSTTLLIGTRSGKLYRVSNANLASHAWSDISGPFVGSISDIEYGNSANQIFVTLHNYNVNNIWFTIDGGATWEQKDGDFPDIPVKCILQNPLLPNSEVIIGTELGVWYTNNFSDASPNWRQSFNGMRNVKVTDLDLRNDNMVFASTYGRGVFSGMFTNAVLSNTVFNNSAGVKIYPNPASDFLIISIDSYAGNKLLISLIDINGKEVLNETVNNFTNEKTVSLKTLQSGIYILKLQGENISETRKIIKK